MRHGDQIGSTFCVLLRSLIAVQIADKLHAACVLAWGGSVPESNACVKCCRPATTTALPARLPMGWNRCTIAAVILTGRQRASFS